jgi:hypothetical protein
MPVTAVEKDLDALTMTITAEFGADAERLWALWSDPRQLERWWGPPSAPPPDIVGCVHHGRSHGFLRVSPGTSPSSPSVDLLALE